MLLSKSCFRFRMYRSALALILFALVNHAWAWSRSGHEWVAQSAALQLNARELAAFDALLKEGIVVPPAYYHASLPERLGAVAAWPDAVREQTIQALFKTFGSGVVPASLAAYAKTTTANWHYTNAVFVNPRGGELDASGRCRPRTSGELINVWPHVLQAYSEAATPRDKNVVLALALHLAADAYQPLHLISAVDEQCEIDRGGNALCLKQKESGGCELNLHQLWDGGFGVFNQPMGWHKKQHPLNIFSFNDALKLAREARLSVYPNNRDYEAPSYFTAAQTVAIKQADFAVGHSLFVLRYLLTQ